MALTAVATSSGTLAVNNGIFAVNTGGKWNGGNITVASTATFQNTGAGTDSIANAATLSVSSGGVFDQQQTGAETIGQLTLNGTGIGGTGAWVNNSGGSAGALTASSGISLATDTTVGGTGNLSTASVISGVGTAALTKVGTGTLVLTGTNTYTGITNINAGKISAGSNAAVGSLTGGAVNVNGSITFDFTNNVTTGFVAGGQFDFSANNQGSNGDNFATKQFNIAGAGPDQTGAIFYNGSNGQQNAFGRIALTGDAVINIGTRADLRNSTPILDLAGHTLIKTGAGQFNLVGASVSAGNIVVMQGQLGIESNTTVQDGTPAGSNGTITFLANTFSEFFGDTTATAVSRPLVYFSNVHIGPGSSSTISSVITLKGNVTLIPLSGGADNAAGTSTMTFNGSIGDDGSARSITKQGANNVTLGAVNTYGGSTTLSAGTVTINTTTATFGNGGGSLVFNGGTFAMSSTDRINANAFTNPIVISGDSTISSTAARNIEFTTNSITSTGSGSLTVTNSSATSTSTVALRLSGDAFDFNRPLILAAGGGGGLGQLALFNPSGTTNTISGVISGPGSINRSVSTGTAGTTILSGNNTYSGGTTLNNGFLAFGISSTGAAGAVTSGPAGTGVLTFNAGTIGVSASGAARVVRNAITVNSSFSTEGSNDLELGGDVALGGGTRTITTNNAGLTTLSGTISSTGGGLTKAGPGTLVLSGTNTFTGAMSLNGGQVNFASINNLGAGTAVNFGGGALQYATGNTDDLSTRTVSFNAGGGTIDTNANDVTFANPVGNGGLGGLTKSGNGRLQLNGGGTHLGTTNINGGVLGVANSLAGAVNVNNGGAIAVNTTTTNGTLTTGDQTWNTGGTFVWKVSNDGSGTAGSDWDLLKFTSLNIAAVGQTFQILVTNNGFGTFDQNNVGYHWAVAKATSGTIAGFDSAKFVLNTSGFTINNGGSFFVTESQDSMEIDVNYVPEPSSIGLLALGSATLLRRRRRLGTGAR
jgi:fibronectin-binding autotransporter adhesin